MHQAIRKLHGQIEKMRDTRDMTSLSKAVSLTHLYQKNLNKKSQFPETATMHHIF